MGKVREKLYSDKRLNEDDVAEALSVALNNMVTGLIALLKNQEPVFRSSTA